MLKFLSPTNATTVNKAHSHPSKIQACRLRLTNFMASGQADENNDWTNDLSVISEPPMSEWLRRVVSMDAVVKLFCFHSPPDPSQPWQRNKPYWSNSSGFVIEGRMILTNAHSVDYHTQVKVKKRGSDTKYLATVLAIGTECDIAMLTVRDDKFWEGISPVKFGVLPARLDAVTVVGYPIGGDTISVTNGVVSRIEILPYVHGSTELLGMQIDAAINYGNSGGPVFNDKEECVGIAFQCLVGEDVQSIGYVIPVPVVKHFIRDYEKNGAYTGFPILGIEWQKMESPALCDSVGMRPDQKGIRVRGLKPSAQPSAPESQRLKPSDVFLSFDGVNIASDGTVPFRDGERIGFSYLVSQKYIGDNALVKVLRNRKTLVFNIKLAKHKELIPSHIEGKPPFYIIAGFVFIVLSRPYERSEFGDISDIPNKLSNKHVHAMAESIDEHPCVVQSIDKQIVVVSQVLAADINIGYEDSVYSQVETFNGMAVKNLKSLASMVENCNDEYLKFGLEGNQSIVLQTKRAKAETQDILTTHGIPSSMSDDLKIKESVSKKKMKKD